MSAHALALELMAAHASRQPTVIPPSARDAAFDLDAAYAVEAELVRLRATSGRTTIGRKVGFANKAMWRVLKLDSLVWAHMLRRHCPVRRLATPARSRSPRCAHRRSNPRLSSS